jgi:hypothetical protein
MERLAAVRERHGEVLLIVAPPRTASTALARVLWNHPAIGFYSHEPFEPTYYRGAAVEDAVALLEAPAPVGELGGRGTGRALLVKEMTFQVGEAFPLLAGLATKPIVFLVRDPRLSIASRMRVLRRAGRPEVFPLRESGWEDLERQLAHVREQGIEHLVVDATRLRAVPIRVVPGVLERLGLSYDPALLTWRSSQATGLSIVSGEGDPFYEHVLESSGLEAPVEDVPALDEFPEQEGFRAHVAACVERYEALKASY